MIHCQGCGAQIAENAPTCPKCGKPNSAAPTGLSTGLVVGIVLVPFIFAWFTLKKGVSTKARVLSFLWMLIALALAGGSQSENPARQTDSSTSRAESSEVQVLEVTPSQLFRAYEDNEIKADNTYKGQYVKMTGRIEDIGKDLMDDMYITFPGSDFFGIQVYFNPEDQSEVANLNKGSTITVVCKVEGLMGNVLCNDAALM
jgi:hypothetical protein